MSADTVAETTPSKASAPRRWMWILAFIVVLAVVSFGYLNYISSRDNFANNDFYRVLYEASNKFNENLSQLDKMHENEESINSIRTQLPSYKREQTNPEEDTNKNFNYILDGKKIKIESSRFDAEILITDILPSPKQGFSQYLFANNESEVLATIGNEKTISIVDLDIINKEIENSKHRLQINLKESGNSDSKNDKYLPGYSSHVDMKLSHEEFRIFIFPFSLETPLITQHKNQKQEDSDTASADDTISTHTINTLYLVGLLPKNKLHTEGTGNWNLSLLVVILVSLLFIWTLLRLAFLPKNQSITPLFRNFTLFSSYGFFIVLIALALAFMQKTTLQASKDREASAYAKDLSDQLNRDLYKAFNGLASYRPFYHNLLTKLDGSIAVNVTDVTESNYNPPATDDFSQMVKNSLAMIIPPPCQFAPDYRRLPDYAITSSKAYRITYNCLVAANGASNWQVDIKLDQSAELALLQAQAHQKNVSGKHFLGFLAGNLEVKRNKETEEPDDNNIEFTESVESFISQGQRGYLHANIFSVSAINGDGKTTLPPIFYQEYNAPPQVLNLAHRDYYKKVRDYQGWKLELCPDIEETDNNKCEVFNNVYIQRLLNIGDGTRGTTIAMPMYDASKDPDICDALKDPDICDVPKDAEKLAGELAYTLGADIILPSLSLAAPAPYDFTYMVIDRNSGDVLFHSDESRTLVENLFYSGNNQSNLSSWIKAGLDHYPELREDIIDGHYHGQSGRFALIPATVDAWAIVIFYPDDSLDALMTNQFFLISVSFAVALLVLVGLLFICRYFFCTSVLKNKLSIPAKINGRVVIIIASILLSVIYTFYYIDLLFDLADVWQQRANHFSWVLTSIGVLILVWLYYRYDSIIPFEVLILPYVVTILLSIVSLYYLQSAAQMPLKALGFHYQQVRCNWLNHERQESIKMALSRYPNSITQQSINPLTLLPLSCDLQKNLCDTSTCEKHSFQVDTDDYPNLNTLMGATYLWQWIMRTADLPAVDQLAIEKDTKVVVLWPVNSIILVIFASIITIWLIYIIYRFLSARLYCSNHFLQHIERLAKSVVTSKQDQQKQDQHNNKLIIECARVELNGIGLPLLLRSAVMYEHKFAGLKRDKLLTGFDTLYQLSPFLQKLGANNSFLPNLKLNVEKNPVSNKLDVKIWDIETCLEQAEFRQQLLDLIMEIKSLTLANQLNSFTICTGFHSLQRVKMKDPLTIEKGSIIRHTEYVSWAECLMDFNVKGAEAFKQVLDEQFLKQEMAAFPELYFFLSPYTSVAAEVAEESIWKKDGPINESQWATIHYILVRAEALYRFKWESCSNVEKLALLNLDKQHSLNPANTQMIEHLAMNGLVKVKQGRLEIVNSSFAHFIRHAETTDTVNQLVSQSEAGFWKDYRLPIVLLVFFIIVGIALTSGKSIYIIAVTVAGVLGTIAALVNSASTIGEKFK